MIGCLGSIFAGGKASGVYLSDTAEQFQYKCHHSRSSIVLVESLDHVKLISKVIKDLPYVKAIVVWNEEPDEAMLLHAKLLSWPQFMTQSESVSETELDSRIKLVKPGNSCSLIYTSGTSTCSRVGETNN